MIAVLILITLRQIELFYFCSGRHPRQASPPLHAFQAYVFFYFYHHWCVQSTFAPHFFILFSTLLRHYQCGQQTSNPRSLHPSTLTNFSFPTPAPPIRPVISILLCARTLFPRSFPHPSLAEQSCPFYSPLYAPSRFVPTPPLPSLKSAPNVAHIYATFPPFLIIHCFGGAHPFVPHPGASYLPFPIFSTPPRMVLTPSYFSVSSRIYNSPFIPVMPILLPVLRTSPRIGALPQSFFL